MVTSSHLQAWEFDRDCEYEDVVRLSGVVPPSFGGYVVSARGGVVTLQVTAGAPTGAPESLYYVAGHGPFSLARVEQWPSLRGAAGEPRLLVTLRAIATDA